MSSPEPVLGEGWKGGFYSFPGRTRGLEGVTGDKPEPVDAGWGPLGGAGTSPEGRRGLGVERSMVWVGGALGLGGAWWLSSPTSMASSLSEEALDSSSSEGGAASG